MNIIVGEIFIMLQAQDWFISLCTLRLKSLHTDTKSKWQTWSDNCVSRKKKVAKQFKENANERLAFSPAPPRGGRCHRGEGAGMS